MLLPVAESVFLSAGMAALLSVVLVVGVVGLVSVVSLVSLVLLVVVSLVVVALLAEMIVMVAALVTASLLVGAFFGPVVSVESSVFGMVSSLVVVVVELVLLVVVVLVGFVVEPGGLLAFFVTLLLPELASFVGLTTGVVLPEVLGLVVVALLVPPLFSVVPSSVLLTVLPVPPFVVVVLSLVTLIPLFPVTRMVVAVVRVTAAFLVALLMGSRCYHQVATLRRLHQVILFILHDPRRTQGDDQTETQAQYKRSHCERGEQ